jgi:hypothetical protein
MNEAEINSIFIRLARLVVSGRYLFKTSESKVDGLTSRVVYFVTMMSDAAISHNEMIAINARIGADFIGVINASGSDYMAMRIAEYDFNDQDPFSAFLHLRQHKLYNNAKSIKDKQSYLLYESKLVTYEMLDYLVYCHSSLDGFKDLPEAKDMVSSFNRSLPF